MDSGARSRSRTNSATGSNTISGIWKTGVSGWIFASFSSPRTIRSKAIRMRSSRQPDPTKMKNYIPSLNGLRALSIFSVLLVHINIQEFNNAYRVPLLLDRELGVNVFFILSGFLITTLLLQEE